MTITKLTNNIQPLDEVDKINEIIDGKQDTSNLVTSISASSTDAQYPSAKCMYDIVGNIETLLQGV